MSKQNQKGFTILELMIATMVFSVVLLLVTYGIVRIGRRYYKAALDGRTQSATRNVIDDISRSAQFSGGALQHTPLGGPGADGIEAYCINGTQYIYRLHKQQGDGGLNHVLVQRRDTSGTCAIPASNYMTDMYLPSGATDGDPHDMLAYGMRLVKFNVTQTGKVFTIDVRVASGADDVLCSPMVTSPSVDCNNFTGTSPYLTNDDLNCKLTEGSQFCAVSGLSTVVIQRISS